MKTKKQILAQYNRFKILDDKEALIKQHLYEGPQPLSEYQYQRDLGYKYALEWILDIKS
ncbi:MAG: hypothetical protein NUV58_04825 [Candidatus Roizmanbacteria bacterium]|nr:hypothetical protein [Candidatus Roizmanbacteria bacterium]